MHKRVVARSVRRGELSRLDRLHGQVAAVDLAVAGLHAEHHGAAVGALVPLAELVGHALLRCRADAYCRSTGLPQQVSSPVPPLVAMNCEPQFVHV